MIRPLARPVDAESIARRALADLSIAFGTRDLDALLASFTDRPTSPTYAGSEAGETATGREALRVLLGGVLARPQRYRFAFAKVTAHRVGPAVYVVADGMGHEAGVDGIEEAFPYRVSGVLAREGRRWRWAMLAGSEPTETP